MFAKALLLTTAFFVLAAHCALAEEVPDHVMINTIKCEAGRVAQKMVKAKLGNDKKLTVSWAHTQTIKREGGLGANFPFFNFGASGDLSKEDLRELKSDGQVFNLHPDNEVVCQKVRIERIREGIGVYECLYQRKFATLSNSVEQQAGTASCKKKITLSRKLSGNLRLKIWGVDAGPSGSWGDIEVYEIAIAAPNHSKEK